MQDIRMETFLAVCEHMNFTRAGEALGLTQPAVSRQMKSLETHYGIPLFCYRGKRLGLTAAGERLCRAARAMRADEERLQHELRACRPEALHFGTTPTPGEFLLPVRLQRYLRAHPHMDVRMTQGNTGQLLHMLDRGEIEFAVVEGNFSKSDYAHHAFSRQRFQPVCAAAHPACDGGLDTLLGHTLVLREQGSGNREILDYCLARHNLRISDFAARIEVNNASIQKALVRTGCGIAFLFEAVTAEELASGAMRAIRVEGFPLTHEVSFVWRRDSIFTDAYAALAKTLAEQAAD